MKTLHATVAVTLDIFFFVYVDLRCIANKQKKISKMSTFPPPGKISADAHGHSTTLLTCLALQILQV